MLNIRIFSPSLILALQIFCFSSCVSANAKHNEIDLYFLKKNEFGAYQIPSTKNGNNRSIIEELKNLQFNDEQMMSYSFIVSKSQNLMAESRSCEADAGFIIDGCSFIVQNNKKDLRIYVGYGNIDKVPCYILNRFSENISVKVHIVNKKDGFEWAVETPIKTYGGKVVKEEKFLNGLMCIYTPAKGKELDYSIKAPCISNDVLPNYESAELHPLFKFESTSVSKYDWNEPAAKHLVLESIYKKPTAKELDGLRKYLLEYKLPTHNYMNYYFRKRMNSYMMEWLYNQTKDEALLDKAIQVAYQAVKYRNDNFGKYKISYNREVAPLWPNYKEVEVYEDASIGLVPGASAFAGLASITVPIRMIASNSELWEKNYNGISYYDIALHLIDEALETIDYTYDVFVGNDNLIRYPNTLLRKEWHGKVYIYNRVFPLLTGSIPLIESLEKFQLKEDKVTQMDAINQAMINFLTKNITFYGSNGHSYLKYPYSQAAQDKNPDKEQVEDFMHGSFDSRDFQLFYLSGRYGFDEKYLKSIANTLVELVSKEGGKFTERMDGSGEVKSFKTPISYDGFIWYASYRAEVYDLIINHIIDNEIAIQNEVWDAYCLYEILKLKDMNR